MVKVTIAEDGSQMRLETPENSWHRYPSLDRLCGKLSRRGFTIVRTGKGHIRHAIPQTPQAKAALLKDRGRVIECSP
jgi:hypothetical protein